MAIPWYQESPDAQSRQDRQIRRMSTSVHPLIFQRPSTCEGRHVRLSWALSFVKESGAHGFFDRFRLRGFLLGGFEHAPYGLGVSGGALDPSIDRLSVGGGPRRRGTGGDTCRSPTTCSWFVIRLFESSHSIKWREGSEIGDRGINRTARTPELLQSFDPVPRASFRRRGEA